MERTLFRVWIAVGLLAAGCSGSGEECEGDLCASAGETQCADGRIRICEQDTQGCLIWGAYTDCESGACQDDSACLECEDECAEGESECGQGSLRSCVRDQDGCLIWGEYADCPSGFCADASTCGECADPCEEGETECSDGRIRTCEVDQHGCKVWGAYSDCPEGFCQDASSCGTCDNSCEPGDAECSDGQIRTCEQDVNGCWSMGDFTACEDGFCADDTTCGVCDDGCPAEGVAQCVNAEQRACVADANGCLDWGPPAACDLGYCASAELCGWLQWEDWVVFSEDGEVNDVLGIAVDLCGDTLVAGAPFDDNANGTDAGAVYVFVRDHGGADAWGQVAKLLPSDGAGVMGFGDTVAIDGDTLVVGSDLDGQNGLQAGAAYVFERDLGGADAWGQVCKLVADDGTEYDAFGCSVSVSGDTIAVGAVFDGVFGQGTGSVYVFERDLGGPGSWGQAAKIPTTSPTQDYLGNAVAIDGDTLVAGAYDDDELDTNAGAAYVYERDAGGAGNWGQVVKLMAADGEHGDEFGFAVDVDGDTVVVGAWNDDGFYGGSGSAYVYERDQGGLDSWGQVDKLTPDDGDFDGFGSSLSVSGDRIILGVDATGLDGGVFYLFQRLQPGPDGWAQALKIRTDTLTFGRRVAIDLDLLAIGIPAGVNEDQQAAGAVHIYRLFE
ncbi:MAG: FG-GAP repeat protein [Deltaproteobacteria bacterium]|nr:FG-GAP repeat protein [Deltaproteobacteria bacterium]